MDRRSTSGTNERNGSDECETGAKRGEYVEHEMNVVPKRRKTIIYHHSRQDHSLFSRRSKPTSALKHSIFTAQTRTTSTTAALWSPFITVIDQTTSFPSFNAYSWTINAKTANLKSQIRAFELRRSPNLMYPQWQFFCGKVAVGIANYVS